jgi:dihydroorotase-like cyclic amidohydrolase
MSTITIPAMLDPHVHLRGLDWAHKGTFASETAAALAGGYWAVFDMPNTPPTTTICPRWRPNWPPSGAQAVCDWGVYFGASQADNTAAYPAPRGPGLRPENLQQRDHRHLLIEDQASAPRITAAWPRRKIIAVHAEARPSPTSWRWCA